MTRTCPGCGQQNRIPPARLSDTARCGRCKEALPPVAEPIDVESDADFDAAIGAAPYRS
jgi:thioredoxin 2